MPPYSLHTPPEVSLEMASRLKRLRLDREWKQSTLADRAGVSLGSLRRFESSGRVSLQNLLRLAFALGRLDELLGLFEPPPARTLDELEALQSPTMRQRGRR